MPKVILISQFPLPFSTIGSWTTLYKNYLQATHQIDYLVCLKPTEIHKGISYIFVKESFLTKFKKKLLKNNYLDYFVALDKILQPNQKYILQIADNFGIVAPLQVYLEKKGIRKNCYLQFFYHGFAPFYENFASRTFFETINEMVLLTHDSYLVHKNYYTVLPCRFSVLHNGVDTTLFYPLQTAKKQEIKAAKNLQNTTIFVWCSQDRPKKGLSIVLEAWQKVHAQHPNTLLWVIGTEANTPQNGVVFLGKIPNSNVASYLQLADCYLFPTLCHEGFGLSLIEALHCGCYCIASSIGGVPEVLQHGKLGTLIENPHFVLAWVDAMLDFLEKPSQKPTFPATLYSQTAWNDAMNSLLLEAKNRFSI